MKIIVKLGFLLLLLVSKISIAESNLSPYLIDTILLKAIELRGEQPFESYRLLKILEHVGGPRIELELAAAAMAMGNNLEACNRFDEFIKRYPNAPKIVLENAEIGERAASDAAYKPYLNIDFTRDSNPFNVAEEHTIHLLNGIPFLYTPAQSRNSGSFVNTTLGIRGRPHRLFEYDVSVSSRESLESRYSQYSYNVSLVGRNFFKPLDITPEINIGSTDGELASEMKTLEVGLRMGELSKVSNHFQWDSVSGALQSKAYKIEHVKGLGDYLIQVDVQSNDSLVSSDSKRYGINVARTINSEYGSVVASLGYSSLRYDDMDPFFMKKREDSLAHMQVSLMPRWVSVAGVAPEVVIDYYINDSNISINKYRKHSFSIVVHH